MKIESQDVALEQRIEELRSNVFQLIGVDLAESIDVADEFAIVERQLDLNRGCRAAELLPASGREESRRRIPPYGYQEVPVFECSHEAHPTVRRVKILPDPYRIPTSIPMLCLSSIRKVL
jgi:hypothetical protein